jgi:hypothetical protein
MKGLKYVTDPCMKSRILIIIEEEELHVTISVFNFTSIDIFIHMKSVSKTINNLKSALIKKKNSITYVVVREEEDDLLFVVSSAKIGTPNAF